MFTFSARTAFAHKFALTPENFTVGVGASARAYGTFTEIIGAAEYSFSLTGTLCKPGTMNVDVKLAHSDGTETPIPDSAFEPYSSKTKSVVSDVNQSDSERVSFTVTKPGTSVLNGKFSGQFVFLPDGVTSRSHVKAFLNLTNDGMATKRLGGGDVLEVVFAEDVPAGGVSEGSVVKFRFYHKGAPLANAPVFAAYAGAPVYTVKEGDADVEVNDYLEKVTDGGGYATFLLDHAAGWFVGAFVHETSGDEYGGGLIFDVKRGDGEGEGDITEFIIKDGANLADVGFPTWVYGDDLDGARDGWGLVNASNLVTAPNGSTSYLSGGERQLPGGATGASINIPLDISRVGVRGMTGTEQLVELTADVLGADTYDEMAAFLKDECASSPDKFFEFPGYGAWYVPPTPKIFFDRFGVSIMGKFSNGTAREVGEAFQLGVLYNEEQIGAGSITILYGTMLVDSAPVDGAYWSDVTEDVAPDGNPNRISLIYDGASDDKINFSYWLARKSDGGGGGCSAGAGLWGIFGLMIGGASVSRVRRGARHTERG
jgi:hypothetical protein